MASLSGAMLLPSLIQVTESISGSVVPLAMFVKFFVSSSFCLDITLIKCLKGLKSQKLCKVK